MTAAGLALLLLAPVLVLIAVLIRLTSPGPAIFRQTRVGVLGKDFTILKFRTMYRGATGAERSVTTDQRITGLGRVLRRHKLDELPQLINVLTGHMSLVGPRPKLRSHHEADWHLRPGITGAASVAFAAEEQLLSHVAEHQLEDCHRELITPRKTELDLRYAATATFRADLRILLMTLMRVGRYTHLDQLGAWSGAAGRPEAASSTLAPPPRRSKSSPQRIDAPALWETGSVSTLYRATGTRGPE